MKKRLPVDIQFLLESILDESPDKVDLGGEDSGGTKESDPTRLNSLGAEVPKTGGTFRWRSDDAYAFFFDVDNNVVMYCHENTHTEMQNMLAMAASKAKIHYRAFGNMYDVKRDKFGNITAYSYREKENYPYIEPATIGFIGLPQSSNDLTALVDYLSTNVYYFRELDIRGHEDTATVPAGRIWIKRNVISFWNQKDTIIKENFSLVEELMKGLKVEFKKFAYEFLDHAGLFAYKELVNGSDTREKLSPEEMKKLMAVQHLDPKAKEKLAGSEFRRLHRQKAAKGFDFPAQASAAMPARESKIKLKDLINEDPDAVYAKINNRVARITHYGDDDAAAFMTFPTFSVVSYHGVHYDIKSFLANFYIKLMAGQKVEIQDVKDITEKAEIEVSDIQSMLDDLKGNGVAAKAFKDGIFATATAYRYKIKKSLSGRIWADSSVIAFWNKKEDVLENWGQIRQMFKDNYGLGSAEQYRVDFLERSESDYDDPLVSGEEVTKVASKQSEPSGDKNQLDFFGKLLNNPNNLDKLSDAQMEKLAGKLHLLTPAEKNRVMKAAGMNNNKAAEIASKMGLSVAEFHHLMQVNEEKLPSLQEIVNKIRSRK